MTAWSWIFLAGWPVAGLLFARLLRELFDGRLPGPAAYILGMLCASMWPFALFAVPFAVPYWAAKRILRTHRERRDAADEERRRAMAQARALDLPWPEMARYWNGPAR